MVDAKDPEKEASDSESPRERIEDDPAVERGERIGTGKQIARGGKTTGEVPGAAEINSTQ